MTKDDATSEMRILSVEQLRLISDTAYQAGAAAEREACAAMIENYALQYSEPVWALKITEAIRARSQALAQSEQPADNLLAWRCTGSGLKRFMTHRQFSAQTPGVKKWYEPFKCAACLASTQPVQPAGQVAEIEVLVESLLHLRKAYADAITKSVQPTVKDRLTVDWEAIASDQAMTIALLRSGQNAVAEVVYSPEHGRKYVQYTQPIGFLDEGTKLYTSPPQRQPLTTEQYTALAHRIASKYSHRSDLTFTAYTFLPNTLEQFVRAIESARGIKEAK